MTIDARHTHTALALCALLSQACQQGTAEPVPHPDVEGLPPYTTPNERFDPERVFLPAKTPPALSGGTLAVSPEGLLVAADPDRDLVYLVEPDSGKLDTVSLAEFDEPGRVIASSTTAFVALRGADAVARIDLATRSVTRTAVCSAPRGLTFYGADGLLVACASGELVTLGLDGVLRGRVFVAEDLRDVGVDADGVWVSSYRRPALFRLDASLSVLSRTEPALVSSVSDFDLTEQIFSATLAARTVASADGSPLMLHQRAQDTPVQIEFGGYGGDQQCSAGIVHTTVSRFDGSAPTSARILPGSVVPVDLAVSPSGTQLAILSPGGFAKQDAVASEGFEDGFTSSAGPTRQLALLSAARMAEPTSQEDPCIEDAAQLEHLFPGEATSVVYVSDTRLAVQVREPAELRLFAIDAGGRARLSKVVDLSSVSVLHTGHQLFTQSAGLGIACASCHGEGHDDGHVWDFAGIGPRRTQTLLNGVLDSAPFHWDGDMADLRTLMDVVFSERMGGDVVSEKWASALGDFLSALPVRVHTVQVDEAAALRGRAAFEQAGCQTCHGGEQYGRSGAFDVGTGGTFQVPSLVGLTTRLPLMHDGCANSVEARFDPLCGGFNHGDLDGLSSEQTSDLVAYLKSL